MGLFSRKRQETPLPSRRTRAVEVREPVERSESALAGQTMFRRGRTLSSYGEQRDEKSARVKAHHLAARRRRLTAILLVILAVIGLIIAFLFQLTATVAIRVVNDTSLVQPVDTQRYVTVINQYLDAHPIERLRFSLNVGALSNYVASHTPEVATVTQQQPLLGQPATTTFDLTMRKPVADWEIGSQRYYVDANGVAFTKNYYAEPGVQIIDQSGAVPTEGTTMTTSISLLGFIGKVVTEAGERHYTVTQAVLPVNTTREVDIHFAGVGPFVKFSIDRGAAEQVEDMDHALQYFAGHGIAPGYVDVRISGKAYYK